MRIYRVGNRWFAFALESEVIDYRVDEKSRIRQVPAMAELVVQLARLMDHLGLESGAYKRCPETGEYLFLEVNSAPMYNAFDRVVSGALSDRMIDRLLAPSGRRNARRVAASEAIAWPRLRTSNEEPQ